MPAAELPFPLEEYRDRARRVREEMARRGVDVLYVMSPANICYLTGFESIWYPPRAPLGVVLASGSERARRSSTTSATAALVTETAHFDDAVFFTYETALDTVADAFAERGWTQGSVGIEWHSRSPSSPADPARWPTRLRAKGARIVAGDWIVDRVRLVKSPLELECVRRAAEIVDAAFLEIRDEIRPGRTELQVAARLDAIMADHGGEEAAIRTMVSAGPLVWCRTHAAPAPPAARDAATSSTSTPAASYKRYHVDLCRTVAIGDGPPRRPRDPRADGRQRRRGAEGRAARRPARRRPARRGGPRLLPHPARAGLVGRRLRPRASRCRRTGSVTRTSRTTPTSSSRGSRAT